MSWAGAGTNDHVTWRELEEADAAGDLMLTSVQGYPGGPDDMGGGSLDEFAENGDIDTYIVGDGSIGASNRYDSTKGEILAWATDAVPQNFDAFRDFGACPGSAVDLSWTADASLSTVIEHRHDDSGVWTEIATPAAGVGTFKHTTEGDGADKTRKNNYRIRWSTKAVFATDDQESWVCPS